MEVSKITLQLLNLEITECKKQDLQKKFNIAVNIVKKTESNPTRIESVEDVADLTGVPGEVLVKLKKLDESKVTFEDWSREQQLDGSQVKKIKKFLVKRYTSHQDILARKLLEKLLKKTKMPRKTTKEKEIIQLHLNKFFTHIQLPGTDCSMIVEKPETVRKRFDYFESKLKYQKENRHIVYVGGTRIIHSISRSKVGLEIRGNSLGPGSLCIVAVSTKAGYIDSTFYGDIDWNNVKRWLFNNVLSGLPPGTVVVFCDKLYVEDKPPPAQTASRKVMSDWLQSQDIPHDVQSHKAELYSLIERYKKRDHFESSRIKEYLAGNGHTLLLKPVEVEHGYFDEFWIQLQTIVASEKYYTDWVQRILSVAKSFSVNYWKNLEVTLIERELEEFKADWHMEVVLDKLLNFTKQEGLPQTGNIALDPFSKNIDKEYIFLP